MTTDQPDLRTAIILGVDPALGTTGLALIQPSPRIPGHDYVNVWSIVTQLHRGETEEQADARRIDAITADVLKFARDWTVDVVAVEQQYVGKNQHVCLRLRALASAIEYACRAAGLTVVKVEASERAKALGIRRKLSRDRLKAAIMEAVKLLYGVNCSDDNQADAVAIGLAGRNKLRLQQLTAQQETARKQLPGLGKYGPKKRRRKGVTR